MNAYIFMTIGEISTINFPWKAKCDKIQYKLKIDEIFPAR